MRCPISEAKEIPEIAGITKIRLGDFTVEKIGDGTLHIRCDKAPWDSVKNAVFVSHNSVHFIGNHELQYEDFLGKLDIDNQKPKFLKKKP